MYTLSLVISYLRSTIGICTDVNMTILMNKDDRIMIMIIIIIVEYATFMRKSRNMLLIWIFIQICKNMQKNSTIESTVFYKLRNFDIYNKNYSR